MKFFNRVRVNTATVGQGALTLGSAVGSNMMTLAESGAVDGDETTFVIEEGADFEISRGVVGGSATTITRATVLVSKINGTSGTSKLELSGSGQVRFIQSANDINDLVNAAPFWQRLLELVKTANYTLTKADAGVEIVFNSVSAIVGSLPAVANSNGELYLVRNIGTGTLTIDPNGAETIEGAATMPLLQGQAVIIWPTEAKSGWRAMAAENSPLKAAMRSMLGLTAAADRFPYFTSGTASGLATLTAFARSLLDDPDAAAALTTLGVSAFIRTLLDDADASTAQTTLGIGTMGTQSATNVAITGGSINGVTIGGATPASGTLTTGQFNTSWAVNTVSTTGVTAGKDAIATVIRSSRTETVPVQHFQLYNPNGLVGNITTSASATAYNISSDELLKDFIGIYDPGTALAIIRADPTREFTWKVDGTRAVGWGAQTSYAVSQDLASPGGWFNSETGAPCAETDDGAQYQPWGVDQGKRTPYLWAVVPWLADRLDAVEARLSAAGL